MAKAKSKKRSTTKGKRIVKKFSVEGSEELFSIPQLIRDNDPETFTDKIVTQLRALKKGEFLHVGLSKIKRVK